MAQPAIAERIYTPEEYLELEERADSRSEYWNGRIYAMSGGTSEHAEIPVNIGFGLHTALGHGRCHVYGSDMKVAITKSGPFVYPDVSVVCGEPALLDAKRRLLANPDVVFEVLSESTADYDLVGKSSAYRTIPSIKEIVLVAQDQPWVQVATRQSDGAWRFRECADRDGEITLESIGCALQLATIYRLITFPERPMLKLTSEACSEPIDAGQ